MFPEGIRVAEPGDRSSPSRPQPATVVTPDCGTRLDARTNARYLCCMSVQELKAELAALSEKERAEVSAFLFHLRHASDGAYQADVQRRLDDKDPAHWVPLEELDRRLSSP